MTQIRKILDKQGNEVFIRTSTKAVVDENGYTAESRLQAMQDEINQAQLEVGAVPSDLTPTEGSTNWVTSGGVKNALDSLSVGEDDSEIVLTQYTETNGWITRSNTWNTNSGYKGVFIPTSSAQKYRISCNTAGAGESKYALLTSSTVGTNGSAVSTFATGTTSVILSEGETVVIDNIPSDAKFLWIGTSADAAYDWLPSKLELIYNKTSLNAAVKDIENKIGDVTSDYTKDALLSEHGYWSSSSRTFVTDSTVDSTELIELQNVESIYYTGRMGYSVATWFDENKNLITQTVSSGGSTLENVNVLPSKPDAACSFVALASRNSSHSAPPSVPAKVTVNYYYNSLQHQVDGMNVREVSFSRNGYYKSQDGTFATATTNVSTEIIAICDVEVIEYTGCGMSIFAWYDENKRFIRSTYVNKILGGTESDTENNVVKVNVLHYRPANAQFVGLTTRNANYSTPPICEPRVVVYGYKKDLFVECGVIADGYADTTTALQKVFYNGGAVIDMPMGIYLISSPIIVNTSIVKKINGNGAMIQTDGDISAFIVKGSLTASSNASPGSLSKKSIFIETNTIIEGVKFTSTDPASGNGIELSYSFSVIIQNCYFFYLKNGIVFSDRNRNVIIANNNIYTCYNAGILFGTNSNLHQCNILGNHISYCHKCVYFNNTQQTANVQITGNDIEIDTYPNYTLTDTRCILINYSNTSNALFSEFEIVGNTIQGHEYSDCIIEIVGNQSGLCENISIGSNQISNSKNDAIRLSYCHNVAISNNTYRRIPKYVLVLSNTIDVLNFSNEVNEIGIGYVSASSGSVLYNCTFNGLTGRNMTGAFSINSNTINGLTICNSNISSGNTSISASTVDYLCIANNMTKGTYTIPQASHSIIENNI